MSSRVRRCQVTNHTETPQSAEPLLRWHIDTLASDQRSRRMPITGVRSAVPSSSRHHELPVGRRVGLRAGAVEGWPAWRAQLRERLQDALRWAAWMAAHPDASQRDAMAHFNVEWNLFHRGLSLTRLPELAQAALLDERETGPYPSEWALHRVARMKDSDAQVVAFEALMRRLHAEEAARTALPVEPGRQRTRCGARATLELGKLWESWRAAGKAATTQGLAALAEVSPFKVQRALQIVRGLAPELVDAVLALPEDDRRVTSTALWELALVRDHRLQVRTFDERYPGVRAPQPRKVA